MRRYSIAIVLVVLSAACGLQRAGTNQAGGTPKSGKYGDGVALPNDATPTTASQAGGGAGGGGGANASGSTPKPAAGRVAPNQNAAGPGRLFNDKAGKGGNTGAYVRGTIPKLVIEILPVRGKNPSQQALDFVKRRVAAVVDKPGGVDYKLLPEIAAPRKTYGVADVIELETKYRTVYSSNEAASMFVMYLNGEAEGGGAAGFAVRSSLAAIFPDTFSGALGALQPERVVLLHEVGHLLGMVNLGYTSPRDHCDCRPENGGGHHSKSPKSVMYSGVEQLSYLTTIATQGGTIPDDFDADDKADFADIRSGKIPLGS